jgi:hypothetical protein
LGTVGSSCDGSVLVLSNPIIIVLFPPSVQYVNYSNITLKAGGPNSAAVKEGQSALETGEVEAKIAAPVLRVPECGQCTNCTADKGQPRKLCVNRLEARNRLIETEVNRIMEIEGKTIEKKKSKKRKIENGGPTPSSPAPKKTKIAPGPKKKTPKLMKQADGQLKARVTSQGNKRMAIPDELFADFCKRIGAHGTGERMKLINQFADEHPTISVRQVTIRLGEITTREMPACIKAPDKKGGRAFMFYLRPRFYKFLPPDERPAFWEKHAEEDDNKYQIQKAEMKATKVDDYDKNGNGNGNGSMGGDDATTNSNRSGGSTPPPVDDDGEETEDEAEPAVKRLKME